MRVSLLTLASCLLCTTVVALQRPRAATDVSAAEIAAVFESIQGAIDKQAKVVDVGDDTNVAVGVLHRAEMASENGEVRAIVHHDVTEVYYILSGSGTLLTGGSLDGANDFAPDSGVVTELVGPSASGIARGGRSRSVGAGDVVIIPSAVPHGFVRIDAAITYLSIRVDPEQVLPAGYVNPVLR